MPKMSQINEYSDIIIIIIIIMCLMHTDMNGMMIYLTKFQRRVTSFFSGSRFHFSNMCNNWGGVVVTTYGGSPWACLLLSYV